LDDSLRFMMAQARVEEGGRRVEEGGSLRKERGLRSEGERRPASAEPSRVAEARGQGRPLGHHQAARSTSTSKGSFSASRSSITQTTSRSFTAATSRASALDTSRASRTSSELTTASSRELNTSKESRGSRGLEQEVRGSRELNTSKESRGSRGLEQEARGSRGSRLEQEARGSRALNTSQESRGSPQFRQKARGTPETRRSHEVRREEVRREQEVRRSSGDGGEVVGRRSYYFGEAPAVVNGEEVTPTEERGGVRGEQEEVREHGEVREHEGEVVRIRVPFTAEQDMTQEYNIQRLNAQKISPRFNGHKVTIQVNHDASPQPCGPLDDSFSSEPPASPDARWRGGKEAPRKQERQVGSSGELHTSTHTMFVGEPHRRRAPLAEVEDQEQEVGPPLFLISFSFFSLSLHSFSPPSTFSSGQPGRHNLRHCNARPT